ncbi:hypothetical protein FHK87_17285 [Aquimarina algicola]|uniref:DUF6268 domain-containing protein n=2 Tax=Aquimarina algicola TaxID=2589995 RepID=A0A504J8B1_9FLAO|nr:hypothetical protein FHK87_17285 [Aquimarina algicola]
MKKKNVILICILLCIFFKIRSQDTDLARIEYAYIPQSGSDNVYSRFRASFNYPIKLKEEGSYLVISPQYRYNNLKIEDGLLFEESGDLNAFHTIGLELGYTFKLKNNWRFGAKLGGAISSNFEGSGLEADDLRYAGSLYFVKSYKGKNLPKTSRLVIGLRYAIPASINFPLPIINYYKRFHPSWSYSVGTPKSSIKYFFNEKNTIQTFVSLDNFYGNLQNNRTFIDRDGQTKIAENASMLTINAAVGYEYYFTEHLLLYTYAGYTLSNEIRLRDNNQENVLIINDNNTFYFRSGIKLKI